MTSNVVEFEDILQNGFSDANTSFRNACGVRARWERKKDEAAASCANVVEPDRDGDGDLTIVEQIGLAGSTWLFVAAGCFYFLRVRTGWVNSGAAVATSHPGIGQDHVRTSMGMPVARWASVSEKTVGS